MEKTFMVTGNAEKFREVRVLLPDIEQLDISLPEIQSMDPKEVVSAKLSAALEHKSSGFIVDDTSLSMSCMKGLPGPLIKWFLKTVGNEGLYEIAKRFGDYTAEARTIVGYAHPGGGAHFFEGVVRGKIVKPRGDDRMGWDKVFQPDGHSKTFAEMDVGEKNTVSPRSIAVKKLKLFLETSGKS